MPNILYVRLGLGEIYVLGENMRIEMRIKALRMNKNMSLQDLSKKSGISTTHIHDIENNLKSPSLIVMVILAKALDTDITTLYKIYN